MRYPRERVPYNDIALLWGGKFDGNYYNWTGGWSTPLNCGVYDFPKAQVWLLVDLGGRAALGASRLATAQTVKSG